MTRAREQQINLSDTPYYHCMGRCVRRAYLCGDDTFSGKNYDHRKQWIVARMKQLASVFTIDICAYAVMSNHYHVVLKVDVEVELSNQEIVERWCQLYSGPLLVQRWRSQESLTPAEQDVVGDIIQLWRKRLSDISWYMRSLNEHIARLANKEESCKGRFWEGRFKSQALLDEAAVLTCMTYVDLNPIRANMTDLPETSDYTSIQERIYHHSQRTNAKSLNKQQTQQIKKQLTYTSLNKDLKGQKTSPSYAELLPFAKSQHQAAAQTKTQSTIPYTQQDYFDLLDWTGRAIRENKKGAIPSHIAPILKRLDLNEKNWTANIKHFGERFKDQIGKTDVLNELANTREVAWLRGKGACLGLYKAAA